jgi:hypothetical protein
VAAFAAGLTGPSHAYSTLRNAWVPAPNVSALAVTATFESLVVTTPTTYEGFSARTGGWDSLATIGVLVDQQSAGALAAVVGSNRIDVFDPGQGRWVGQPTANPAVLGIWRLTGIAQDGVNAYGYSLLHKTWETKPLQGTVVTHRANSSIGYVQTTSHLYVFTGNGSLSNQSRFPEFSRFCVRGGEIRHMQVGPPDAAVFGLFGVASAAIPVGILGILRVDPDPAASIVLPLGIIPPDGALVTNIPIPLDPFLNGLDLHMQDVVVPLVGAPWLTNDSVPYVW